MDEATYKLSREQIKKLRVTHYTRSHLIVLLNLLMLGGAVSLINSPNPLLYVSGILLWALQMNHAYLIVHETAHSTFYKKSAPNDIVGVIFAFFALMPFYSRRYEHMTHHREAGSFHEPSTRRAMDRFPLIKPGMELFMTICWKLWIPVFAINEHVMLWTLPFQDGMDSKTRNTSVATAAAYFLTLLALLALSPSPAHWLVTFLLAVYCYMVLVEYFNLPHHLTSPVEDIHGAVPLHEQAKYSRSCAPMPRPFANWLALNFNYHVAHHLYPAIHWALLPEAHRIMASIQPSLGEGLEHEFTINRNLRKQSLRVALKKYFEQMHKESAARHAHS